MKLSNSIIHILVDFQYVIDDHIVEIFNNSRISLNDIKNKT